MVEIVKSGGWLMAPIILCVLDATAKAGHPGRPDKQGVGLG
jgi:hypothetical protein